MEEEDGIKGRVQTVLDGPTDAPIGRSEQGGAGGCEALERINEMDRQDVIRRAGWADDPVQPSIGGGADGAVVAHRTAMKAIHEMDGLKVVRGIRYLRHPALGRSDQLSAHDECDGHDGSHGRMVLAMYPA